jgi:hypothetical protein
MKVKPTSLIMAGFGMFVGLCSPVLSQWVYVTLEPMLLSAGFEEDFSGGIPTLGIACFFLFVAMIALCAACCAPAFKEIVDD